MNEQPKQTSSKGPEADQLFKRKNNWWYILIILVVAAITAGAVWTYYQYFFLPSLKSTETAAIQTEDSLSETDPYEGWQTYANEDIGYTLKYPPEWTFKETNEISQLDSKRVKFVNFYSGDGKYDLMFGLKKADDNSFRHFERTGVGAGDMVPITDKSTTLLGVKIIPDALVYQGRTLEFFYEQYLLEEDAKKETEAKCDCNFTVFYGANGLSYEESETIDLPESLLDISNQILASVSWL